jgi:Holliday junction DNA helicase RuvA
LIAYLRGKLLLKQPSLVIVDVSGVGYEVNIPLSTFYELGEIGSDLSLTIHTHVREDSLQLFGFRTNREKEMFLKLTSVSGIGPRLAITVLSGIPVSELVSAIRSNDLARLTAIPGVGRKTAERMVVELRDKLGAAWAPETEIGQPAGQGSDGAAAVASVMDDTIAALIGLGYQKAVAERAVSAVMREGGDQTIESVLKRSLRQLSR